MKRTTEFGMRVMTLALLLVGGLTSAIPVSAQDPLPTRRPGGMRQQVAGQEGITLNFQNLDLAYVVSAMGQSAGINVVSSNMPEVLGNIQ